MGKVTLQLTDKKCTYCHLHRLTKSATVSGRYIPELQSHKSHKKPKKESARVRSSKPSDRS